MRTMIPISEMMSKRTICRVILSVTFSAALYPLTFIWFSYGGAAAWTGGIVIDTTFSLFVLAYYIGLWIARRHPVRFQAAIHVIWLLLYARMFFIFPQKAYLDDAINLSRSTQSVCAGFYIAYIAAAIHTGIALICSWRFIADS